MELKSGYKQTEVGVIPVDWEVYQFGDLKPFVTSGSRGWADYYSAHGDLFVRITNLTRQSIYLDLSDCKFVNLPAGKKEGIRTQLQVSDVLISITADIGIVCFVGHDVPSPAYINQHIALVRFDSSVASGKFISYFLASDGPQRVFRASTDTGAKAGMSLGGVQKILTALPPLPEQSAIAAALGDVDALIATQDALIAKQRAIRQGAMQELLTGKRRLPGFGGKWISQRLGNAAMLKARIGWQGLTTAEYLDDGNYYLVTGTDFSDGKIDWANCHYVTKSRYSQDSFIQVRARDVLVTKDGTIGKIALVDALDKPATLNSGVFVIRPKNESFVPEFFYYLLLSKVFDEFLSQLSAGSTINHLYQKDFVGFTYQLPPTSEEQAAIAQVLGDVDAVIASLEAKRAKTARLKQGMMQELLTGRIRLVQPAAVSATTSADGKSGGRKANVHFMRSVLAAELIDQLHNEPTFGHVKFEKLIFLTEHLCKVDTGSNYHRDAAGPYDNRALRSIDSQLKTQKWFEAQKLSGRYQYVPLEKHGGHKEYFDRYYASIRPRLDEIIATFRVAKTEQCEIVATLYGAWDDLLKQGKPATDDAIVDQVLNHWHDDKKRIDPERWHKALDWMREKGFVPEGSGLTC